MMTSSEAARTSEEIAATPLSRKWATLSPFAIFSVALSIGITFLIAYPLVRMVAETFFLDGQFGATAILNVLQAPWLLSAIGSTLFLVAVHGILAIIIGALFAWLNERTDARLGLIGDVLPLVPMLLPAIALAIGWIFLASPGVGFINGWLAATLGQFGINIRLNIVSWAGLIFTYTLHAIPYVYLIVSAALRNLDPALEEASHTSGASAWRTFWKVSMPAVKPALLASLLLVVIMGLSHFSLAIIIASRARIDILSVRIMRLLSVDVPPRLDQATVISLMLLLTVGTIWFFQRRLIAQGNYATVGGRSSQQSLVKLGPWRWLAWFFMAIFFLCAAILPLFALLVVSLQPFWTAKIDPSVFTLENYDRVFFRTTVTRDAFFNSIMLGAIGGFLAMFIAAVTSLYARRSPSMLGRVVDGITKLPAALSHLAIAVGFLVAFAGWPFHLGGSLLMLLLVYIVMYMPEASVTATSAISQVGNDLIEASQVSGASEWRTFFKVILPLIFPGLLSGFALVFVLMSGEVTASSLLAKVGQPVIGFAIRDIWEGGTFGNLAALAGAFTMLNIVVVVVALQLGRRRYA